MSGYPPPRFRNLNWLSPTTVNDTWDDDDQAFFDSLANEPPNSSLDTHSESTFIPIYNANPRESTSDQPIQHHSPVSLPLSCECDAEKLGLCIQPAVLASASSFLLHEGYSSITTIGGPRVSPPSWLGDLVPSECEEIEDLSLHQLHNFATDESKITESHTNSAEHESIQPAKPNACLECNQSFRSTTELGLHARESQHAAFKCKCGTTFQGMYELKRHKNRHQPGTPAYPCLYCSRHRGEKGFRRKDHLHQHVRKYHHITSGNSEDEYHHKKKPSLVCPYPHCAHLNDRRPGSSSASDMSNSKGRPTFTTRKHLIQHMRTVHNKSPFECKVEDCDRVGARGYVREGDLLNHYAKAHQVATN